MTQVHILTIGIIGFIVAATFLVPELPEGACRSIAECASIPYRANLFPEMLFIFVVVWIAAFLLIYTLIIEKVAEVMNHE